MKSISLGAVLALGIMAGVAQDASAQELVKPVTGFQARDIAAKVVAPEHRANVIGILGPRVDSYPAPLDWYVWFYVPGALQNGRRFHVVGEQVRGIKEGMTEIRRLRMVSYKPEEVIPAADMAVDTSKIFATVRDLAPLKGWKVTGTSFELRRSPTYGQAVWHVDVYVDRGGETSKFGRVLVGARDGKVLAIERAE